MSGLNRDTQSYIEVINRTMRKAVNGDVAAQRQVRDCWIKLKRTPRSLWVKIYDGLNPQARAHLELTLVNGRVVQGNDEQWVPFRAEERSQQDQPVRMRHDPRTRTSYQ